MTKTRVVTARITPNRVRKLLSLCARMASTASLRVSENVLQARQYLSARVREFPAVLSSGADDQPPRGTTPMWLSAAYKYASRPLFVSGPLAFSCHLDARKARLFLEVR